MTNGASASGGVGLFDDLADGSTSFQDVETAADVDAIFRSQRRAAVAYFALVVAAISIVAVASLYSNWFDGLTIFGGFSASFFSVGIALYIVFASVGLAASTLANRIEDKFHGSTPMPGVRWLKQGTTKKALILDGLRTWVRLGWAQTKRGNKIWQDT